MRRHWCWCRSIAGNGASPRVQCTDRELALTRERMANALIHHIVRFVYIAYRRYGLVSAKTAYEVWVLIAVRSNGTRHIQPRISACASFPPRIDKRSVCWNLPCDRRKRRNILQVDDVVEASSRRAGALLRRASGVVEMIFERVMSQKVQERPLTEVPWDIPAHHLVMKRRHCTRPRVSYNNNVRGFCRIIFIEASLMQFSSRIFVPIEETLLPKCICSFCDYLTSH